MLDIFRNRQGSCNDVNFERIEFNKEVEMVKQRMLVRMNRIVEQKVNSAAKS